MLNNTLIPKELEFDKLVIAYNVWLASLENPRVQKTRYWKSLFRGAYSILDIFNHSSSDNFKYSNPIYFRKDLSSKQKDIVALASDWQRVNRDLDEIILGQSLKYTTMSPEEAKPAKELVEKIYANFRNDYLSLSKR